MRMSDPPKVSLLRIAWVELRHRCGRAHEIKSDWIWWGWSV